MYTLTFAALTALAVAACVLCYMARAMRRYLERIHADTQEYADTQATQKYLLQLLEERRRGDADERERYRQWTRGQTVETSLDDLSGACAEYIRRPQDPEPPEVYSLVAAVHVCLKSILNHADARVALGVETETKALETRIAAAALDGGANK